MKRLFILFTAVAAMGFYTQTAHAQREIIVEKGRPHTRRLYVIENHRPVRRVVFVDEGGRYYQVVDRRRVYVERYYETYPTQYFYRDGRVRPGISITF